MIEKVCANCGSRLSEYYSTGMLGCPQCYLAFEREIDSTLRKVQGAVYHSGKTPKISDEDKILIAEYNRLIKERETATLSGMFARAKELTEQINQNYAILKKRGLI